MKGDNENSTPGHVTFFSSGFRMKSPDDGKRKVALSVIPIAHSGNTTVYAANPVSSRMVQIVPSSHKCVGHGVCPPIHDWKRNVQILKESIANPWGHFSRA